jgi:Glyoxalase-like domain
MSTDPSIADVARQLPLDAEIFLDHVGHFVADREAASRALARAGFAPTPPSIQVNTDKHGRETLTGTGNVTAMFHRGYIEVLFKTAETPLGGELETAIARYPGVHLAAFSVSDAEAARRRLDAVGFRVRPLAHMQRPVGAEGGADIAAFTVARVESGEMAEGRIQILTHHTEATVWQPRWLVHPNGAIGLLDLVIATDDISATANRFARFLGRGITENRFGLIVRLDRGSVLIVAPDKLDQLMPGISVRTVPFMGVYAVEVKSIATLENVLSQNGMSFVRQERSILAPFPDELGIGAWVFVEGASDLVWRDRLTRDV